jgi:hypothetical protein
MMTGTFPCDARSEEHTFQMLHWLFVRDTHVISCDLLRRHRRYELHITPLSDAASATCEVFDRAADARRRHAEVAWLLRESGWLLGDRGHIRPVA